ncbi:MAG: methyltransferase domain-containing protein [Candidatus Bipolaricaulota bacterium]|nr:methyltransferase domain-containing protein [Candidatus Bipolaricaulota bacterium]MCS7275385.1 methyltransferase domain-containing protein [Candidatus Bipolaricaulota bacterium]MDW8110116.1 methyltransferase domain-containing protein [Candidatus Bipolaricaulota bacterium]MDW8328964.1 methyltransferase domain-containing protein [Candidatus Bipolaricaulota bacterium]
MRFDEREELVQEEFDRQAERWVRRALSAEERAMLERMVQAAEVSSSDRVLDVACGTGLVSFALAPSVAEVVGVDISGGMLAKARQVRHQRGVRNVHFVLAEAEHLPAPDESFDAVVCRFGIHHFVQPDVQVREMARVLKKEGRLVIVDTISSEDPQEAQLHNALERLRDPTHVRMLALSELTELVARTGLRVRDARVYPQERDYDQWMEVINEPIRTENLKVVMAALARAGVGAGLKLRLQDGRLWVTHSIALVKAVK